MFRIENQSRLKGIYKQLLEIYKGNYSSRIDRTDYSDDLEVLTVLLNMVTEKLQPLSVLQEDIDFKNSSTSLNIVIIVNNDFKIMESNNSFSQLVGKEGTQLYNQPLENYLANQSIEEWYRLKKELTHTSTIENRINLWFKTNHARPCSGICTIVSFPRTSLLYGKRILIASIRVENKISCRSVHKDQSSLGRTMLDVKKQKKVIPALNGRDISILISIENHVKNNLQMPLVTLRELAHSFGTNEYKVKIGFKKLFGVSVFQFLKNERLKKAHALVKFTSIPIKEIALTVGFKQPNHMSREFKRRYGYNPTELR